MRRAFRVLVVALLATVVANPAPVLGQADDATQVLADMREALGGADNLAAVRTLTAAGSEAVVHARGTTERAIELAMELPATFAGRRMIMGEGPTAVYLIRGFDGDDPIDKLDAPPDLNISGLARRLAARQGRGEDQTPDEKAAAAQRLVLAQREYFAQVALGLFGSSFEAFPLEFSYVGQAESPGGSAHAIGVHGADGFEARLFVDAQTKLPLMLTWSEEAEADSAAIEHRLFYSDFRSVGDLYLPHTFQRTVDGDVRNQITFEEIRTNQEIDRDKFGISQ